MPGSQFSARRSSSLQAHHFPQGESSVRHFVLSSTRTIRALSAWMVVATSILFTGSLHAQSTYSLAAQLTASDGKHGDGLGMTLAASGDTVVMGRGCNIGGNIYCSQHLTGAVYVYQKSAGGWADMTQVAKLTASDGYLGDSFGDGAVAVSGNTIVVSAAKGKIYVFVKPASGRWANMTETAELNNGTANSSAVAIDGDTIVASAANAHSAKAFVFVKPPSGWTSGRTFDAVLTNSSSSSPYLFGISASISGDTIVIGSWGSGAYVYRKPAAGWKNATQTARLTRLSSIPAPDSQFGISVAIDGFTIVAGDPQAPVQTGLYGAIDVFRMPATGWVDATQNAGAHRSDKCRRSAELRFLRCRSRS